MKFHRLPLSAAAILTATALSLTPAAAAPNSGSSAVQHAVTSAAKDAYSALPREIKDNPVVKDHAKNLGLVDKPAPRTAPRRARDCGNCVALTFDDGPAAPTNRLLGILKDKKATASFFVTAPNARKMPKTLQRMTGHGHTVGNHGATHSEMTALSAERVRGEIRETNDAVESATGTRPHWMRPPYGAMNDTVTGVARDEGMAIAFWQVDTLDWQHRDPQRTCRVAVDQAAAGHIILMHDIHSTTVDAAECIVDGLRAKGLEPVSLDHMIPAATPGRVYSHR